MKNLLVKGRKPLEPAYEPKTQRPINREVPYLLSSRRDAKISEEVREERKQEAVKAYNRGVATNLQKAMVKPKINGTRTKLHDLGISRNVNILINKIFER